MRALLAREDPDARLALDVYVHRLRAGIATMAAALGGVDVIAFTGGVGEHAAAVRSRVIGGLRFLGAAINDDANEAAHGDADIGTAGAPVRCIVVTSREDLEIARHVRAALAGTVRAP
jgi:acetate kinase